MRKYRNVLFFSSNVPNVESYKRKLVKINDVLCKKFGGEEEKDIEDIQNTLDTLEIHFDVKEVSTHYEIYNQECEYVFCINKAQSQITI